MTRLELLKLRCKGLADSKGWDMSWQERGCCLHLEASELIEALRGKGNETVTQEAGDVLFVLLTILASEDIHVVDVVDLLEEKITGLEAALE